MKLLCINSKDIKTKNYLYIGTGLEEGKIYSTKGKPFIDGENELYYYIDGLGARLCRRFTELLDDSISEMAITKLKEEFQLN